MAIRDTLFKNPTTGESLNYNRWNEEFKIHELFGIELNQNVDFSTKLEKGNMETVDPENHTPFPPEMDDLIRLHFFAVNRRATTIMEFGVGKSTVVFADALRINKEAHASFVAENLRRANPFELHSVETSKEWLETCKTNFPQHLRDVAQFYVSDVRMDTFNGRACTMYDQLPNVCPDIIYLDGPDQYNISGDVNGISTRTADRLPMAADILMMEPFLLPGTLIITDGRTANARFIKNNLQGNWDYHHFEEEDIHAFELIDAPLGKINARQIQYCIHHQS